MSEEWPAFTDRKLVAVFDWNYTDTYTIHKPCSMNAGPSY